MAWKSTLFKRRPTESVAVDDIEPVEIDVRVEGDCEEYEAWADRMHEHPDALARVRRIEDALAVEPTYWRPEHLLRDTSFGQDLAPLDHRRVR